MPSRAPDARGGFRRLAGTLVAGALYDLAFAAALLLAPELVSETLGLPLPEPRFYLRLVAVLLAMVGASYLAAARDPWRLRAVVAIAIGGRFAGFVALALAAASDPALAGLWPPAVVELAFAIAHLATARGLFR
jgi:hypothetical protein